MSTIKMISMYLFVFYSVLYGFNQENPIKSGFGADGPYEIVKDSFPTPGASRLLTYIFRPKDIELPVPGILFCHDFGEIDPQSYQGLIDHIVSRGYALMYPPTKRISFGRNELEKIENLFEGIDYVLDNYPHVIDTSRIGFIGHGYGAGALPSIVWNQFTKRGRGKHGSFMYLMSPWYSYGIDKRQLENFPKKVNIVIQVFEHNYTNDPRIAAELYTSLTSTKMNKVFFKVKSDEYMSNSLRADNAAPLSDNTFRGENNCIDYYGIYKVFDALAEYTFNLDSSGQKHLYEIKNDKSFFMGTWNDSVAVKPMVSIATPATYFEKKVYAYANSWISPKNPRIDKTAFSNARKIYANHQAQKISILAKQIRKKQKAKRTETEESDIIPNPIMEGYGSNGSYQFSIDTLAHPLDNSVNCYAFIPEPQGKTKFPVIILLHGYSGPEWNYFEQMISHMCSKGYAVLFPTYTTLPYAGTEEKVLQKYDLIDSSLSVLAQKYQSILDFQKVGFVGQSFGAGAIPYIAFKAINKREWGTKNAFIFMMAPWYTFGVTEQQLRNFPSHVKLVVQVYDDDAINDHKIGAVFFTTISIPNSEKDFITLFSDSIGNIPMQANHFTPFGNKNINGQDDYLDYYGIYRIFDALAEYTFSNNQDAKKVALGNGSNEQTFMGHIDEYGSLRTLSVTDTPTIIYPQLKYIFAWDNKLNPF